MADATSTASRRSFLATGALASIVAVGATQNLAFAASPNASWEAARAAYVKADKAMNDYGRDYLMPATDRYEAWRNQWPMHTAMDRGPEMKAAYAAASALYDPVQDRFDDLADLRSDARAWR